MSTIRSLSSVVITCFKRFERAADWLTGAAGPVFVGLCWTLIVVGGIAFFDVLIYTSPSIIRIALSPLYILIAINLYGHYYLVTHIDPGHPSLSLALQSSSAGSNSRSRNGTILDGRSRHVSQYIGSSTLVDQWPRGMKRGDGPWRWNGGGPESSRSTRGRREDIWVDPMASASPTNSRLGADGSSGNFGQGEEHLDLLNEQDRHRSSEDKGLDEEDGESVGTQGVPKAKQKKIRKCRKCDGPKPDRAHHCSVCKRCVLMMDHHCPWINQCVGLHNQRHFILFMASLSLACWILVALGWDAAWKSLGPSDQWESLTPTMVFTLIYILGVAIGIAVPVLLAWHIYLISQGETSIESHDNSYFGRRAKSEGKVYINPWNVGARRNLELAFNVGPEGYPYRTLLFPLHIPSYTTGWHYPQHPLAEAVARGSQLPENTVVGDDDGLTDDEEGGAGFWDGSRV